MERRRVLCLWVSCLASIPSFTHSLPADTPTIITARLIAIPSSWSYASFSSSSARILNTDWLSLPLLPSHHLFFFSISLQIISSHLIASWSLALLFLTLYRGLIQASRSRRFLLSSLFFISFLLDPISSHMDLDVAHARCPYPYSLLRSLFFLSHSTSVSSHYRVHPRIHRYLPFPSCRSNLLVTSTSL